MANCFVYVSIISFRFASSVMVHHSSGDRNLMASAGDSFPAFTQGIKGVILLESTGVMIRFYLVLMVVFFWKTAVTFADRGGTVWSDFINGSHLIAEARTHKIENRIMYFTILEVFKGKPVREFQLGYDGPGEDEADLRDPVGTTYMIFLRDVSFQTESGVASAKPGYFFVDERFMKKIKMNDLHLVDKYTYRYLYNRIPDDLFTSLKPWYQYIYEFPGQEMMRFGIISQKIFIDEKVIEWEKMKAWLRKNANTKQPPTPIVVTRKSAPPYLWIFRGLTILIASSCSLVFFRSRKRITGGFVASLILAYVILIIKHAN